MAKKNKLPHTYLSYSQMSLWLSSKNKYADYYFKGNKIQLNTPAVNFGKKLADKLEAGEFVHKDIIVLGNRDVAMFTSFGGFQFIYKCDSFDPGAKSFVEYKSGTYAWTQSAVNNAMQLRFYTACIYNEFGILPPKVHLQYMPTRFVRGKLGRTLVELIGTVETFEFRPTLLDTLKFSAQMVKVAKDISIAYDRFCRTKSEVQRVNRTVQIPRSTKRYFTVKKEKTK